MWCCDVYCARLEFIFFLYRGSFLFSYWCILLLFSRFVSAGTGWDGSDVRIADYFDVVAYTSTSGLLTTMITSPDVKLKLIVASSVFCICNFHRRLCLVQRQELWFHYLKNRPFVYERPYCLILESQYDETLRTNCMTKSCVGDEPSRTQEATHSDPR
jgi:hypothetical protein